MFKNKEQLDKFLKDRRSSYDPMLWEIRRRMLVSVCMVAGAHWINRGDGANYTSNYLNRLPTQWTADGRIRTSLNRINKFTQKIAAATFPDSIDVEVLPPDRDTGIPGAMQAQVMESLANTAIDVCGLLAAWRRANFFRCVNGAHGIGLSVTNLVPRDVPVGDGSVTMEDQTIRAFDFDFTRLVLDPARMNEPLDQHDEVVWTDTWTAAKLRRVLPSFSFDESQMQTIGDIEQTYININRLSGGRLYAGYANHSSTKGARVWQVHCRGEGDRFDKMYVGVEIKKGEVQWINLENPESPYGGNGIPFMLLRGHLSPDGYGFVSDVEMMKDDQDQLNLVKTFYNRMLQKNAGYQWLVDIRGVPNGTDDEALSRMFHNTVGGLVRYVGPTRDEPRQPPQLVRYPDIPAFIQQMVQESEDSMRKQIHRSDANFGVTQTHIPNASFQRALEEADEVVGQRVRSDIEAGNTFCKMVLGTTIAAAQRGAPTMLSAMRESGMDEQDIGVVLQADPHRPPCGLIIRESTVRYRSHAAKRADLDKALQLQSIDPMTYRLSVARDLDSALTEDDRFFVQDAQKAAYDVLMGEEWKPTPLGGYSSVYIDEFRKASRDRIAKADPETQDRLKRAIVSQMMADAAEQGMRASIAQAQQGQVGGDAAQTAPDTENDDSGEDAGKILAAIGGALTR